MQDKNAQNQGLIPERAARGARHDTEQPVQVLRPQRLVEPNAVRDLREPLHRHAGRERELREGITRREMQQHEPRYRDQKQQQESQPAQPQDIQDVATTHEAPRERWRARPERQNG